MVYVAHRRHVVHLEQDTALDPVLRPAFHREGTRHQLQTIDMQCLLGGGPSSSGIHISATGPPTGPAGIGLDHQIRLRAEDIETTKKGFNNTGNYLGAQPNIR